LEDGRGLPSSSRLLPHGQGHGEDQVRTSQTESRHRVPLESGPENGGGGVGALQQGCRCGQLCSLLAHLLPEDDCGQPNGEEDPNEVGSEGGPHAGFLSEMGGVFMAPRGRRTLENPSKSANIIRFRPTVHLMMQGGSVNDSVAVDAKRILLRYGAPIAILDKVSEDDRIRFAREVARTKLPDREPRLRELLKESGYVDKE